MAFAASTVGRDSKRSETGEIIAYKMAASKTIYKGDIVALTQATGLVESIQSDATTVATDKFAGVAAETVTSGATVACYVDCYVTGIFEFDHAAAGLAVTDLGKEAYADITALGSGTPHHVEFAAAPAVKLKVGVLQPPLAANTLKVRVRINAYAGCISAAA